jgi:hypothetical protein
MVIFKVKHTPELNCLSEDEGSSLFETPKNPYNCVHGVVLKNSVT